MPIARRIVVLSFLVLGLVGCGGFKDLAVDLDGKADATQLFWARLQGIQWRGNKDISSLSEANVAVAGTNDVDGVARGFSMLSQKHSQLATQLMHLDASNVDEIAIVYRDRLVAAHKALSDENKTHASATDNRDMQSLSEGQARLKSVLTEYAQLCGEKDSVMSQLKNSYGREFDVAE